MSLKEEGKSTSPLSPLTFTLASGDDYLIIYFYEFNLFSFHICMVTIITILYIFTYKIYKYILYVYVHMYITYFKKYLKMDLHIHATMK